MLPAMPMRSSLAPVGGGSYSGPATVASPGGHLAKITSMAASSSGQVMGTGSCAMLAATAVAAGCYQKKSQTAGRKSRRQHFIRLAAAKLDTSKTLPFVVLSNDAGAEATIHLLGGCVTSYKANGQEWLGMRKDAKFDGTKPISGGLPHCFPQFGPGDLQLHGFARNLPWELLIDESTSTKCVLQLCESEESQAMWPKKFQCLYTVELLDDRLNTTLVVKNTDKEAWSFSTALHSYYEVSDVEKCEIEVDVDGKDVVDRVKEPFVESKAEGNKITIEKFTDEIYSDVWPGTAILKDSKKGELTIESTGGWRDLVIWNPLGEEGMGYKSFICVESAQVSGVELASNEEWEGKLSLIPKAK